MSKFNARSAHSNRHRDVSDARLARQNFKRSFVVVSVLLARPSCQPKQGPRQSSRLKPIITFLLYAIESGILPSCVCGWCFCRGRVRLPRPSVRGSAESGQVRSESITGTVFFLLLLRTFFFRNIRKTVCVVVDVA